VAITSTAPELRPPAVDPHAERAAREAGLRYVSDGVDGYRRVRQRGRFVYLDARGRRVADPAELERIARLAIPPA
jgi:DNA topoisomerase-1